MKTTNKLLLVLMCFVTTIISAQKESPEYLKHNWKYVAAKMPEDWYGSNEAKLVAENVLLSQKKLGGWEKNKEYHKPFTEEEREHYTKEKNEIGGTFDNGSTITELKFLAKIYSHTKDKRYKEAFENGLNYIFIAQYKNGGWPQYFPTKKPIDEINLDHTEPYSMHITYNDDAMVNIMQFLKEIYTENKAYASLKTSKEIKNKAKKAFDNGVACILKSQIVVKNQLTVWCAQENEITLAPANARAYELASFSGSESVGILLLLMDIENPSKEIISSVTGAVNWFEKHKIEGIKLGFEIDKEGKKNMIVIEDKTAPSIWARFYDLETEKPFFCSRDGVKRNTLAEISYERRNGYGWYTSRPQEALTKYAEWILKVSPQ